MEKSKALGCRAFLSLQTVEKTMDKLGLTAVHHSYNEVPIVDTMSDCVILCVVPVIHTWKE